ncbi:photosynthetic reaction center cytochrome PufC [Prosthecodimorpha staleyi]|uniref:Photosynthetic reaction center cytochrome c subunit n=1 Tax=Prosthecodimorpha staleyi TaxID=2840188 RepID=A0A947D328_9HYPH|nr:photosynthetic reaction center cytochrome PufC [Prosthecodimorpha staleyi]MBT9289831.1 photosynthetic reaction center cytochrome c subunit [Prosthecodimorpha staleyi]
MTPSSKRAAAALMLLLGAGLLAGCKEQVESKQSGYRGTGMVQLSTAKQTAALAAANQVPEAQPPASQEGKRAKEVYKNVTVLGDLSEEEFNRTMLAINEWVAPEAGCDFCHNTDKMEDDSKYQKVVARRMFQMTQHINEKWKAHVGEVGVTCYTCHRGNGVPAYSWVQNPGPAEAQGMAATGTGKNKASWTAGITALYDDPFTPLLTDPSKIRLQTTSALAPAMSKSIQDTEMTYSLMFHLSQSLGVNCDFCHNSRSFSNWSESNPQRVTAWHGLRMVSEVNKDYISLLAAVFPDNRKGPLGDPAKANCQTCHQGANKPLLGASMLKDYRPALATETTPK